MRPDGLIRSVHFLTIEHPEKGPDWQWPFDNPDFRDLYDVVGTERVWELYMAKLLDDIEKLPGHIVGHFYVPANFGHWPDAAKLGQYEDQLLDACAARGMAIEINTRYLYRDNLDENKEKYREALMRLVRKAKEKHVGVAIGSDAHSPKDQGNGFAEILKMLDDAEINELVFPVNGRLARVALRATKEHLQKVKSQEPVPQPGSSISGFSRAELGLPERDEAEEREAAAAAGSKTGHDAGPRKRASGPARATKKPAKETSERETKAERAAKAEPAPEAEAPPKAEPKAKAKSGAVKAEPKTQPKAKAQPKAEPKAERQAKLPGKANAKAPAKQIVKAVAKPVKAAAKAGKPAAKPSKPAAKATAKASAKVVKKAAPAKKAAAAKRPAAKAAPAKKGPAAKKAAPKKTTATKKAAVKKPSAAAKRKVSTPKRAATKKTTTKRR
jgi:histidinol phosphatase-like PHP family hydrolase